MIDTIYIFGNTSTNTNGCTPPRIYGNVVITDNIGTLDCNDVMALKAPTVSPGLTDIEFQQKIVPKKAGN